MNLKENVFEGLRSIKGNLLRTVLTALIISLGITSLVGILTAIDGIQSSVDNSFSGLGANSFDIRNRPAMQIRREGQREKRFKNIDYRQASRYKTLFSSKGKVSLKTNVNFNAIAKHASKKTNPNTRLVGIDDNFMELKGYKVGLGRNFSTHEFQHANNVCLLGVDVIDQLYEKENPVNSEIIVSGQKLKVVGILEKKGSMMGGGDDRVIMVPLETGRKMAVGRNLTFDITTSSTKVKNLDDFMEEARGAMRKVRMDPIGAEDSFSIDRSDSIAKSFENITSSLRIGGFVIGFITLLGAAIALMNIMMVSVTERTREIGIRKSLGATPFRILQQFLIEAIVICLLGGLGGIVLAIPIGNLIAQGISSGSASFIIPWVWMITGIIVCILVGLFSGIYPAFKASKLDPVDALRYE
ncbi:FtsX-like permease family protein [Aquirufa nivalisilvae]|uniref:Macrolide export ATP-binding/permease protein MacB n=1 Tax=Aquirufa nivalisilvae TaxID=2516557 RepID=A0A2S2DV85_9BACT|nr:ABC transporter permease [Aquirufa nivalisilvae]AWL09288.1 Macrolide export ATP-binding/permease protein MacB [Aquirufa nivalisilvae]MCZ2480215.1 FtsX-like permease family protein [Aquirufa nivalisilvae]MCZ2482390.1 FtsX-like permease family protein [Aquirufa nivalisilvae]TBH73776.1 FtsX-like permease family protein [Aquirufa nivalisilvae]